MDLRAPVGAEPLLNYRLKDVVRQLLGLKMPYFPGLIDRVPYAQHRTYLTCDLLGTWALYGHLWPRSPPRAGRTTGGSSPRSSRSCCR
ncbi:MAG: hypothetical protein U0790_27305 [Isosphaeraceae bacterium]